MADYVEEYKLQCYRKIEPLNSKENPWIVVDSVTESKYVMRKLSMHSQEVYLILKTIRHPNILEVVDFFSYGGSLYVIEEYLEWEPLSSAINDRSFSRRDAFAVGRQLLEAFSAENGLEGCNGCFDRICRLSRWISCENGSSLCHSGCGGSTDIIRLSRRCI